MALTIQNHYLAGLPAAELDTSNQTPNLFNPPEFRDPKYPDSIIIHYTAMATADAAVRALCNPATKASAHLVVARDGKVFQLAPFHYRTWHAGTSEYEGRKYYNNFSIGIEIDNLGWLDDLGDGTVGRKGVTPIPKGDPRLYEGHHWNPKITKKYWEGYTQAQIDRVWQLCELLLSHYQIKEILGHDEISVNRKQDPGPAFPMEDLKRLLNGTDRSQVGNDQAVVQAALLNIRDLPDASGNLVARPLNKGTAVEILERRNGWCRVRTEIEGWVSEKYLS